MNIHCFHIEGSISLNKTNKEKVINLMKDSSYSINDLSVLRAIFQDMKKQSGNEIKINHLRLQVESRKKASLNRAFTDLVLLLTEK